MEAEPKRNRILLSCNDLTVSLMQEIPHCSICHGDGHGDGLEPMREITYKQDGYEVTIVYCCGYALVAESLSVEQVKKLIRATLADAEICDSCGSHFFTTELAKIKCPECKEQDQVDLWAATHDAGFALAGIMAVLLRSSE
jgi:hypothetical protein